eukprot:Phypoly_transcript_08034.p1 GENE.Phypoly_transcript_08034~~Phypoly_transcript_08034.p1  ORF type:complete len:466 (+),score=80.75 Phypoly_transcript_08034:115-1512(+)
MRSVWEVLRSTRMASTSPSSNSSNKNFCLYKKEPGNLEDRREGDDSEVSVLLVATDLDADKESHLRRYVVQKASKSLLYKSGTINAIPRGSASPSSRGPVSQLVAFIALVELAGEHLDDSVVQERDETGEDVPVLPKPMAREYYICFLCEVADNDHHSLGLFHTELKNFTDHLVTILQQYTAPDQKEGDLIREFTISASAWYWTCVEYITRCVKLLDTNLDKVIYAILLGKQVVLAAPQPVFDDLAKLLLVVSIVNLSPQAPRSAGEDEGDEPVAVAGEGGVDGDWTKLLITCTPAPLTTFAPPSAPAQTPGYAHDDADLALAMSPKIPHAHPLSRNSSAAYITRAGDYGDVQVTLNTKDTNNFCTSWANQLRNGTSDPFRLRTLLEDLKLKVIQELNFIRKVIDQAKLSNYQLYKSYVVLRANSNCDVLLNLLMKDITNDATTTEVLEVIYEHMQEEMAGIVIS